MPSNHRSILVAVDGGSTDEGAARLACGLARTSRAKVVVLYVIEVGHELPLDIELDPSHGEEILDRLESIGRREKCSVEGGYVQARHAGPAIVEEAVNKNAEIVILGLSRKRYSRDMSFGGTIAYVLKNAPCQVLLWRDSSRSNNGGADR